MILSSRDSEGPFQLCEVDIEDDAELHARFLERIPVVEVDGELVSELHLDARTLRRALARAGTGTVRSVRNDALEGHR